MHEGDDRATSLSIDTNDDIFAVGLVGPTGGAEFSNWWRTYNTDGDAVETGSLPLDFTSLRLAIHGSADEHRYVGAAVNGDGGSPFNGYPLDVGLFTDTFEAAWTATLDGSPFPESVVGAPACAGDGRLVVGGAFRQGPTFEYLHRGFLSVYDSGGGLVDSESLPAGEGTYGSSCVRTAVAANGSYVTLCYLDRDGPWRLRRHSPSGVLQFEREVSVDAQFVSWLQASPQTGPRAALAMSGEGAVAVVIPTGPSGGVTPRPEASEITVFGSTGAPAWSEALVGAGGLWIRDAAFTLDEGLVVVGETADARGVAGQQMLIQRFDTDGGSLWSDESGGSADGDDRLRAVEVDSQGAIVVLGEAENDGTEHDLVLRKYTP